MTDAEKAAHLAAVMGTCLLSSGSEIFRVEDTIRYVTSAYDYRDVEVFTITNGLFIMIHENGRTLGGHIGEVPRPSVNLKKVSLMNQLSREITEGRHTLDEAIVLAENIAAFHPAFSIKDMLAAGIGAGAFCYIFGGPLSDCFFAFIIGFILWKLFVSFHTSGRSRKVLQHITVSFFAALAVLLLNRAGLVHNMDATMIGSIIPLIPGVSFINGVRDLADGDYISGSIRLLDAVLIFICIAAGVALAMRILI